MSFFSSLHLVYCRTTFERNNFMRGYCYSHQCIFFYRDFIRRIDSSVDQMETEAMPKAERKKNEENWRDGERTLWKLEMVYEWTSNIYYWIVSIICYYWSNGPLRFKIEIQLLWASQMINHGRLSFQTPFWLYRLSVRSSCFDLPFESPSSFIIK